MFVSQKNKSFFAGVIAMLSLSACQGIFGDIYNEPLSDEKNKYGFIEMDHNLHTGKIYINASKYTEWHYIDLANKQVDTRAVDSEAPAEWSFAIHRYDAKTHGGAVTETEATDFGSLPAIQQISPHAWVTDEWTTEKITTDMSQMVDGVIQYAEDFYNPTLSKWLHVNTATMPPVYTLSGKIYLLKLADGTYAALRLSNFMNDAAVKGYMTIDYLYPIQL